MEATKPAAAASAGQREPVAATAAKSGGGGAAGGGGREKLSSFLTFASALETYRKLQELIECNDHQQLSSLLRVLQTDSPPGFDINWKDREDQSRGFLHRAALLALPRCLRALLRFPGINVSDADSDGATALHLVVIGRRDKLFPLSAGAVGAKRNVPLHERSSSINLGRAPKLLTRSESVVGVGPTAIISSYQTYGGADNHVTGGVGTGAGGSGSGSGSGSGGGDAGPSESQTGLRRSLSKRKLKGRTSLSGKARTGTLGGGGGSAGSGSGSGGSGGGGIVGGGFMTLRDRAIERKDAKLAFDVKLEKGRLLAVVRDAILCVEALARHKIDLEAKDSEGKTACYLAIENGLRELAMVLMTKEVRSVDGSSKQNSWKPIHLSAIKGDRDQLNKMVERGHPDRTSGLFALTPLHLAVLSSLPCTALLIAHKADVRKKDRFGHTPLHFACMASKKKMIELLLETGADLEATTEAGRTPLMQAAMNGKTSVVDVLAPKCQAKTLNGSDRQGMSPLMHAARWNHVSIIRILAKRGVNVKQQARVLEGFTALHFAAERGNYESAAILIEEAGADVEMRDDKGRTALHIAALYDSRYNADFVRQLIGRYNAQPTALDANKRMPMHYAVLNGCAQVLGALLQFESCREAIDTADMTTAAPLIQACNLGNHAIVQLLTDASADQNVPDSNGLTAVHYAALHGHARCLEVLLNAPRASPNCVDDALQTPLHHAVRGNRIQCVALLCRNKKTSLDWPDKDGFTPLHYCAIEDRKECAALLIASGASIEVKDNQDRALNDLAPNNFVVLKQKTHGQSSGKVRVEGNLTLAKHKASSSPSDFAPLVKQRFWAVLSGKSLHFYKDNNRREELHAKIRLKEWKIRRRSKTFKLSNQSYQLVFRATTSQEHEEWVQGINKVLAGGFQTPSATPRGGADQKDTAANLAAGLSSGLANTTSASSTSPGASSQQLAHHPHHLHHHHHHSPHDDNIYIGKLDPTGKKSGQGLLVSSDGQMYMGTFIANEFNGLGSCSLANGALFKGAFIGGKVEGKGAFAMADGTTFEQQFEGGVCKGEGRMTFTFPPQPIDNHNYLHLVRPTPSASISSISASSSSSLVPSTPRAALQSHSLSRGAVLTHHHNQQKSDMMITDNSGSKDEAFGGITRRATVQHVYAANQLVSSVFVTSNGNRYEIKWKRRPDRMPVAKLIEIAEQLAQRKRMVVANPKDPALAVVKHRKGQKTGENELDVFVKSLMKCVKVKEFVSKEGDRYRGGWKKGRMHGNGEYDYATGRKYKGQFRSGRKHGKGVYLLADGSVYDGQWKEGRRHGTGSYNSTVDGSRYEGSFADGRKNGRGVYTFSDGSVYDGEFANNKMHGRGTYRYADGEVYQGDFVNDAFHGTGVYSFAAGDRYEGEYQRDKMHGKGTYFFGDGRKYEGDFVDGKFNGQGRETGVDGSVFVGRYVDDEKDGQGVFTDPKGKRSRQTWQRGRMVSSVAI